MWRRVARTGGERWIDSAPTDERRKAPKSSCNGFRFRFRFRLRFRFSDSASSSSALIERPKNKKIIGSISVTDHKKKGGGLMELNTNNSVVTGENTLYLQFAVAIREAGPRAEPPALHLNIDVGRLHVHH